ncbi:unnamed protein product [Didymodactylos carnosus]|uniref:Uncharacterized protein n=1 Tax=Didymodactylos carnosus TaxID=1234261 RepID=A0A814UDN8_9BILA|nr:unnamed protein product [Didymodactylos carnosus]CAF1173180.1 unnamed protein product [Didymodactylos carnosus]CAF3577410.1 unnamed protein product [Didymodactylos carnosus]CAF3937040.1 unnamed protein product [Didymodactylos carnosus]
MSNDNQINPFSMQKHSPLTQQNLQTHDRLQSSYVDMMPTESTVQFPMSVISSANHNPALTSDMNQVDNIQPQQPRLMQTNSLNQTWPVNCKYI